MMGFSAAKILLWLALALPAILVLYFLKLRRTPLTVGSILLWRLSEEDLRVNAPFRRLRTGVLLVLQLLVMAACVAALARPYFRTGTPVANQTALILDASASMATRDAEGGSTRFEEARLRAHAVIDSLTPDATLCVIEAGGRPVMRCGFSADRRALHAAVDAAQVHDTGVRMDDAVRLAVSAMSSTAGHAARLPVILISDGAFPELSSAVVDAVAAAPASRFIMVGRAQSDNAGITAAECRAPASADERTLFLRVEHYGSSPREAQVELTCDGAFLDRKTLRLPARAASGEPGFATVTFPIPANRAGLLTATLDGNDALPADNRIFHVLEAPRATRVLLVSAGNPFLEEFFAVAAGVTAERIAPDAWTPARFPDAQRPVGMTETGVEEPYDLVLFDRWVPEAFPTLGAYLVMGAVPALPGVTRPEQAGEGTLLWPMVIDWRRTHPLMRQITSFDTLQLRSCPLVRFGEEWTPVLHAQGILEKDRTRPQAPAADAVLMAVHSTAARTVAVMPFDLYETRLPGWPSQVSFALFMANAIEWLGAVEGAGSTVRTGAALRVAFPRNPGSVVVRTPSGAEYPLMPVENSVLFTGTDEAGFYRFSAQSGAERTFACNLLSETETDNAARAGVRFGEILVQGAPRSGLESVDLWPWVVLAALVVLLAEWHIYNRRSFG